MPRMGELYWVYILASRRNGTLYVGVTNDLARRMHEHRTGVADGFTFRYGVTVLVYAEAYENLLEARTREGALKKWRRRWKVDLIERDNPEWRDLFGEILG